MCRIFKTLYWQWEGPWASPGPGWGWECPRWWSRQSHSLSSGHTPWHWGTSRRASLQPLLPKIVVRSQLPSQSSPGWRWKVEVVEVCCQQGWAEAAAVQRNQSLEEGRGGHYPPVDWGPQLSPPHHQDSHQLPREVRWLEAGRGHQSQSQSSRRSQHLTHHRGPPHLLPGQLLAEAESEVEVDWTEEIRGRCWHSRRSSRGCCLDSPSQPPQGSSS